MIDHHAYPAEPWAVRETALDLDVLGQAEGLAAAGADVVVTDLDQLLKDPS